MLSKRFNVPVEICDSGIVEVVGKEQANLNCRVKAIGEGETLYWCRAVGDDGEAFGGTFAVGSDELAKWEEVSCIHDTDGDDNCHRCFSRGGCRKIGGPFLK